MSDFQKIDIDGCMDRDPDVTNSHGEKIWENFKTNMALVLLEPGTRSEYHYHKLTTETYGGLRGKPTLYLNGRRMVLSYAPWIVIKPWDKHLIINISNQDALFVVQSDRKWDPSDQYSLEHEVDSVIKKP